MNEENHLKGGRLMDLIKRNEPARLKKINTVNPKDNIAITMSCSCYCNCGAYVNHKQGFTNHRSDNRSVNSPRRSCSCHCDCTCTGYVVRNSDFNNFRSSRRSANQ